MGELVDRTPNPLAADGDPPSPAAADFRLRPSFPELWRTRPRDRPSGIYATYGPYRCKTEP
jgi:hypothetical protein